MKFTDLPDEDIIAITRAYRIWRGMQTRCSPENRADFKNYGGRGITVCEEWRSSFTTFLRYIGLPKPDESIDRIDVNDGYRPGNVRWATFLQQSRNKRNTIYVTIDGRKMPVTEAAEEFGMMPETLRNRIRKGWKAERAVQIQRRVSPLADIVNFKGEDVALVELAKQQGISLICLKKRMRSGMTAEEAVAKPLETRGGDASKKRVVLNGEEGTIKEFAERRGMSRTELGAIYARMNILGWTVEQAFGLAPRPKRTAWNKKPVAS